MLKILRSMDLFGKPFNFTILDYYYYKTTFGGIVSILCLIIIIVFGCVFGMDFINKKSPKILEETVYPEDYNVPLSISNDSLVFAWKYSSDKESFVDILKTAYLNINFRYENFNNQSLNVVQNISYSKCNPNKKAFLKFNKKLNISQWYCFDLNNTNINNFVLNGFWDSDFIKYVEFSISFCKDSRIYSKNTTCTNIDEIKTFFKTSIYFEMLIPEVYFRPENIDSPMGISYRNYYTLLNYNTMLREYLYFSKIELIDDLGWIVESKKPTDLIGIYRQNSVTSFLDDKYFGQNGYSSEFFRLFFYCTKSYVRYSRSFMKIQDLASILGGLIKLFMLMGDYLTIIPNDVSQINKLFREFFDYSLDQNYVRKSIMPQAFKIKINQSTILNPIDSKSSRSNRLSFLANSSKIKSHYSFLSPARIEIKDSDSRSSYKNPEYKITLPSSTRSYTDFGLFFYFRRKFNINKLIYERKYRAYDLSKRYFLQRLDVVYYLKILSIFDAMKYAVFNKHQILAFNHIKIPNLACQRDCEAIDKKLNNINEDSSKQVIKYFEERIRSKSIDEYDNRILNIIYAKDEKNFSEFSE